MLIWGAGAVVGLALAPNRSDGSSPLRDLPERGSVEMASQYQHRQFFRRVPNALLAKYFKAKKISLGVDLGELKESEVEPIFEAFTALPEDEQAPMQLDFQDINTQACDAGMGAPVNEAAFHEDETFPEEISAIDGHHAKAMWAHLNRHEYWRGAAALLHADSVGGRYWRKRNDLPRTPPHVDGGDIQQLADGISNYFFKAEGRGRNCMVEPYRKVEAGKEYFFAYPEDYGQSGVEWESDALTIRPRHPAFEIIFVYCESEGSLDIYAPNNTKAVPELQQIFAKAILKLEALADGAIDSRVYDLDPLADPDFEFRFPAGSGISEAIVNRMRLTMKGGSRRRVVLEADTKGNSQAVYGLLRELHPPHHFITQVGIKVVFEPEEGKRPRTRTFNITYPNSCNLTYEGKDATIRQMLVASGIEPRPVKDENSA